MDRELSTDSSLIAAGAVSGTEYFRTKFPRSILTADTGIVHLELWAIIIAVKVWGNKFTGKIICIRTDNEAVSQIVNTGHSKDLLQKLLHELIWWLAIHQFRIKIVHLAGKINALPDILSRWHEGPHMECRFMTEGGKDLNGILVKHALFKFTHDW